MIVVAVARCTAAMVVFSSPDTVYFSISVTVKYTSPSI
uniref:Uncharacterized protein n=1 Tax=Anguilla anguilla TaxID=7936 RepID=A0A0E9PJL8_ANGAN